MMPTRVGSMRHCHPACSTRARIAFACSGVGQRNVLPADVEEFRTDRFFELTYLSAQRRLSGAQACRCARKAELFGDRNEVA
jgi:hypothetical protein